MYTIAKTFGFEAAHHLPHLPDGHKCRRPHGHSYTAEIVFESASLDEFGFVVDYGQLDVVKRWIDTTLDHHDLNAYLAQPSAEHLAQYIFGRVFDFPFGDIDRVRLVAVRVSETRATWAEWRP